MIFQPPSTQALEFLADFDAAEYILDQLPRDAVRDAKTEAQVEDFRRLCQQLRNWMDHRNQMLS